MQQTASMEKRARKIFFQSFWTILSITEETTTTQKWTKLLTYVVTGVLTYKTRKRNDGIAETEWWNRG